MIKCIVICTICILTVSAFALLTIYKPFSNTASPSAAPAPDEEQAASETADENKNTSAEAQTTADEELPASGTVREINVHIGVDSDYTFKAIDEYAKKHWNFEYKLNIYTGASYYSSEDVVSIIQTSLASGDGALDIYRLPASYTPFFIKGEYSGYACPYKELGIDVETALKKADIPDYMIESGYNPDGELIALPYLAETNVFLYKRSVAKDVWGTDDPDKISGTIGGGSQKWDKLIEAARTLKEHGYYIAPDFTDFAYMSLKNLSSLETLELRNNMISDISCLEGKQNLKILDASRNNISNINSLGGLASLESLNLSSNEISDISALRKLSKISNLDLSHNEINDISSLRKLMKLEVLFLNGNKISDISSLKGLKNLKELHLSGNNIADRSPADHVESVTW